MMKFIFWLFNSPARHWREINTYHKGAWGRVLTAILLPLICAGATVGLTYLSCKQFGESFGIGVLVALFAVAFFLTTIEYGSVFALVAFKSLTGGVILSVAQKIAKKTPKNKNAEQPFNQYEGQTENTPQNTIKTYKAFDLFLVVFNVVITIGIIVGEILLILNFLKTL